MMGSNQCNKSTGQSSGRAFLRWALCAAFSIFLVLPDRQALADPVPAQHAPSGQDKIPVAFVISDDAVTIDFGGPWEVFKDVYLPDRGPTLAEQSAFRLYTVSDSRDPVTTSGGMRIIPDYTFDDVPSPMIVVVPAQRGRSEKMLNWIRKMSTHAQVLMSVCTGASVLGDAGVLDGKRATTHHLFYDEFHNAFPKVILEKNKRFVQSDPVIFTSAGLSSGIDLALHVVELYFGRSMADRTAQLMEYEGKGWIVGE